MHSLLAAFLAVVPAPEVGIPAISTHEGFGHACPISPTRAFTARHVVDLAPLRSDVPLLAGGWWNDEDGHGGAWKTLGVYNEADLALIEGEWEHWWPVATAVPKSGDRIRIVGFEWRNKKHFLGPRLTEGRYIRITGGMMIVSENPGPGSSGSCALNEAGEVVGVEVWGWDSQFLTASGVVSLVGVAVSDPTQKKKEDE